MIRALREFLESVVAPAPRGELASGAVSVELATAVLLVEAMRADAGTAPEERAFVAGLLQKRFALQPQDVQELLAVAEERSRLANDFFAFTHVLNERLGQEHKREVIELMWRIAYADGSADPGESHIISRIAELLHVPHGEYIAAKLHAQAAPRP
jgi:uncharacterized tellurite resistance protein B-like protein